MRLLELLLEMSSHDAKALIAKFIPDFPFENPTPEAIKKARWSLSKKFHPDRGGSEEQMKLVNDALDSLKRSGDDPFSFDAQNRRAHDRAYGRAGAPRTEPSKQYPFPESYGGKPGEKTRTPPWGWAGAQWRRPDSAIDEHDEDDPIDFRDVRDIGRYAWRISGKPDPHPREEYNFKNFEGHYFRGSFTVYTNQKTLAEIASLMLNWDFHGRRSKAILVKRAPRLNKANAKSIVMPVVNGKISDRSEWFALDMSKVYDEEMSGDWNKRKNIQLLKQRLKID